MQIVINISEKSYKNIKEQVDKRDYPDMQIGRAIVDGVPLPKGHGDLKDADKLKHAFIKRSMALQGSFTDYDIASIVYNSPIIIEADKTESEG